MKSKNFERQGIEITLSISPRNGQSEISGIIKNNGKEIKRSALFPSKKALSIFEKLKSFEGAEKIFYHLKTGDLTKANPKQNPIWEKLKSVCAPEEGPDETYIFDEKSSGIYTPVLEGIAHKNPRRPSSEGYMKLAQSEHDKFHSMKEKDYKEALHSLMKAYRLYDLASHIAYFHNAKKLKGEYGSDSKVIENLLKLQDEKITRLREDIFSELQEFIGDLESRGENETVREVQKEFTLNPHEEKQVGQRKTVRRTLAEQVQLRSKRFRENEDRIETIEEEIKLFEKALQRKNLHEIDKERLESLLENSKRRLNKLKESIETDKEVVDAVKKGIPEKEPKQLKLIS